MPTLLRFRPQFTAMRKAIPISIPLRIVYSFQEFSSAQHHPLLSIQWMPKNTMHHFSEWERACCATMLIENGAMTECTCLRQVILVIFQFRGACDSIEHICMHACCTALAEWKMHFVTTNEIERIRGAIEMQCDFPLAAVDSRLEHRRNHSVRQSEGKQHTIYCNAVQWFVTFHQRISTCSVVAHFSPAFECALRHYWEASECQLNAIHSMASMCSHITNESNNAPEFTCEYSSIGFDYTKSDFHSVAFV